jgi:hypothetical protein
MDMHFVVVSPTGKRFTSSIFTPVPTWDIAVKCAIDYAQIVAKTHGPVKIETIERVDCN